MQTYSVFWEMYIRCGSSVFTTTSHLRRNALVWMLAAVEEEGGEQGKGGVFGGGQMMLWPSVKGKGRKKEGEVLVAGCSIISISITCVALLLVDDSDKTGGINGLWFEHVVLEDNLVYMFVFLFCLNKNPWKRGAKMLPCASSAQMEEKEREAHMLTEVSRKNNYFLPSLLFLHLNRTFSNKTVLLMHAPVWMVERCFMG